jgi:type IV secretory pathway TrbL component
MVASGRLVDLIVSGPFQAAAAVIGTTLVIVGVALVARIASGSRR